MYWTLSDGEPGEVTLCERHALMATNLPCSLFGLGPFENMTDAATELEMYAATFGNGQVTFGFSSSEQGHCGACDVEKQNIAATEGAA